MLVTSVVVTCFLFQAEPIKAEGSPSNNCCSSFDQTDARHMQGVYQHRVGRPGFSCGVPDRQLISFCFVLLP